MIPAKHTLNLFAEIERVLNNNFSAVVLSPILDELALIEQKGAPKERQTARLALRFAKAKCKILPVELAPKETVDDLILRIARKRGYIVATNDKELKRRLRTQTPEVPTGVPVLYLRARSHIEIAGFID
jgi:rRNA-processing protein FCF1